MAADSVIAHRFLNVGGQVFFPGFIVVCLAAMSETIAVSTNPAGFAGEVNDLSGAVGFIAVEHLRTVNAGTAYRLMMDPAQLGIVLKNLAGALVSGTVFARDEVFNPLAAWLYRAKIFSGEFTETLETGALCIKCGECEEKCPYNLLIRDMIEEYYNLYQTEKGKYQMSLLGR